MAQGRSVSKLIATALFAGVSCFPINGDQSFLKFYPTSRVAVTHTTLLAKEIHRTHPPHFGTKAKEAQDSSSTSLHVHAEREVSMGTQVIPRQQMAPSYALIWSPGFLLKFGITTAALLALHLSGAAGRIGKLLSQVWHVNFSHNVLAGSFPNLFLPLLSSSCCLVQLMINALVGAGGCAGFNTVLGPVRPVFLSLLAYLSWSTRPSLPKATLRISLALLPEMVDLFNRWLAYFWRKRLETSVDAQKIMAMVEIEIPTMGCVACINKIDNSLRQSAPLNIVDATSRLDAQKEKGGRATVHMAVNSQEELDAINEAILKSINAAGFSGSRVIDCRVENKEKTETQ